MSTQEPGASGTVSVVVCTHTEERLPLLRAAVRSVQAQTRPPDELLVMVDGTAELAEVVRAAVPGVRVECMGTNQGVSRARTEAAGRVSSELVVFLDDDAEADPHWLEHLLRPLADPQVLGSSGRSLAVFDGDRPAWLPEEFLWVVGCSYRGMPTEPTHVRNFYGGCAMVRRDVFVSLGGFHAGSGHRGEVVGGGEEADFCLRATQATGGTFAFEPAAVIRHHVPGKRMTWAYYLERCVNEGYMKAKMAQRLDKGALGPERAFALAAPRAAARALVTRGEAPQALGIVAGCVAVLLGLLRGRLR